MAFKSVLRLDLFFLFFPLFGVNSCECFPPELVWFPPSLVRSINPPERGRNLHTGCFYTVIRRVNGLKLSALLTAQTHNTSVSVIFISRLV